MTDEDRLAMLEAAVLAHCRLVLAGWDFGPRECGRFAGQPAPVADCRCRTCEAVRAVGALKKYHDEVAG